jgi:hypothetical protein
MINVVKYKTNTGYNNAIKAGNTSSSTILQTHEPFRIIVFDDAKPIRRDPRVVSRITEIEDINQIPTGNALLAINAFGEYFSYDQEIITEALKLIDQQKVKILDDIRLATAFVVEIPEGVTFSRFSNLLNKTYKNKNVFSIIEEDVITEAQSCDYYAWPYNSQWHLDNIEALNAYDLLDNGNYNSEEGVTYGEWHTRDVAILDGHGFEFIHPDLDNNDYPNNHPGRYMTRNNWDCVLNNNNPQPAGTNDKHGTVMAGIAASGWADRRFLRGVGLDHVNAQCLRIGYNVSQTGTFSTATSIIVRGLNKAAINGNCASIVMPFSQLYYSPFINSYLGRIRSIGRYGKGMPIFAASGNNALNGFSNVYPASYNDVMAIGASTQTNTKAAFSNYGPELFATAPGVSIFAIDRCCGRGYNINPDSTYGSVTYFTGTSASSVIAATIAATLVVADPNITELKIRSILAMTARRLGPYTYNDESNEIGLNLGISNEMGNGILTQADAIQTALDMAFDLEQDYINFAIDDFTVTWSETNVNWQTSQPIPASAALRGEVIMTLTNTGPNTAIFGPFTFGSSFKFSLQATLIEDGPPPTEETPMVNIDAFGTGPSIAIAAGASETMTFYYATDRLHNTCGLNGNFYLVCKADPQNQFTETSEEDNFIYKPVSFTTNHPMSYSYCDNNNQANSEPGQIRLCFYDTGGTVNGQSTLGNPNYLVLSELVDLSNPHPSNDYLRINSVTPINLNVTGPLNINLWRIDIQVTNIGLDPIQHFNMTYDFNPGLSYAVANSEGNGIFSASYLGANRYPAAYCDSSTGLKAYLSYITDYPGALDSVWTIPGIGNPLQPGETRTFTKMFYFHPVYFPTVLTARVVATNYRGITELLPIHVKQSNIIYG